MKPRGTRAWQRFRPDVEQWDALEALKMGTDGKRMRDLRTSRRVTERPTHARSTDLSSGGLDRTRNAGKPRRPD